MSEESRSRSSNNILWLVFILTLGVFPFLVMGPSGKLLENLFFRSLLFIVITGLGTLLLKYLKPDRNWVESYLMVMLVYGTVYRIATYLQDISTYQLTLDWSEASRYYYASLFFSKSIYGIAVPPSVLHPTRYLMQTVPFLIPSIPLWFHRFWQVLLWIVFTASTTILLTRRLFIQDKFRKYLVLLWAYLFLLQGPVYYHLLVMVILVLWGYNRKRSWRTLLIVAIASIWAGLSRINWAPVPGMLASTLYFFEVSVNKKPFWRYLLWPAVWSIIGTGLALVSQSAYVHWSGNPVAYFGSSFTSDLLWYRLFPSATYLLGVLPAAVLVSLPLLIVILSQLSIQWKQWHILRLLGLGAIIFVLFAGGVVVSTKIGGGSNLHNLDAYLVMFLVIGSFIYFGKFEPEQEAISQPLRWTWIFFSLAVIVPVGFAITTGKQLSYPGKVQAEAGIAKIKEIVSQVVKNQGEVLFVTERQLLTFHTIDAPLVPDYERVFLMEMAMSNNTAYLDAFYDDLRSHRFALIVIHPQRINYQGASHQFGEENDAWVKRVTEPLLCSYKSILKLPDIRVELYVPRNGGEKCP